jgi:uncharacterized membrane protein YkvA (DUF1232 family)
MITFRQLKSNFKKYLKFFKAVIKDKRTPRASKILLTVAIAYALSPVDLIPDFIPLLGHLDDLIIIPLLTFIAIRLIPKKVLKENYKKIFKTKD